MRLDYSKYQALKLNLHEGILTITISNTGKKNAINSKLNEELVDVWQDVAIDDEVKAIILTGDGSDFCSGADLGDVVDRVAPKEVYRPVHPSSRRLRKHVMNILDCEKPVLAKVRGVAYGMGCSLALACDMVFVSTDARLCDPHVRAGLVAGDGGVLLWPLSVGMHRAKEYLMTGRPVSGPEAERIGLVNRCLSDDELDAYVLDIAVSLRDLPPHAVNYTKVALNTAMRQMSGAAFEASIGYELYSMQMQDFTEAATALSERRPGRFKGR